MAALQKRALEQMVRLRPQPVTAGLGLTDDQEIVRACFEHHARLAVIHGTDDLVRQLRSCGLFVKGRLERPCSLTQGGVFGFGTESQQPGQVRPMSAPQIAGDLEHRPAVHRRVQIDEQALERHRPSSSSGSDDTDVVAGVPSINQPLQQGGRKTVKRPARRGAA